MPQDLWKGLNPIARSALATRDYTKRVIQACELVESQPIPGVELFHRRVYQQHYRGYFAEFARQGEGKVGEIGLWPRQWATAVMYSIGFHLHPPHIPEGTTPEAWFKKLFVDEPTNYALRPYDLEQWDCMFFISGIAEMFLIDERAGMPRRKVRFIIEGDDMPGPNNVGVVIPAGVAHAVRCASSKDLVMVYGTSTVFAPENEGRIEHAVETPAMPPDWEGYWNRDED